MKEQDLRDKFEECVIINHVGIDTDQCVQIAKDYADAQNKELIDLLKKGIEEIIHLKNEYRDSGHCVKYLSDCEKLFKNRENER